MTSRPHLTTCVRAFEFNAEPTTVGDGRTLEGYAAVFNKTARIASWGGDFDEEILPGAFARSLSKRTPVMQFEHGRDARVGSLPIGAIEDIHEDSQGLYVRARLMDDPVVDPIRKAIGAGSISGMSFRFQVPDEGDTWTKRKGDVDLRQITEADTSECGPVVFPAYDTTTVSVRSMLAGLDEETRQALIRELAEAVRTYTDLDAGSKGGDLGVEPGNGDTSHHSSLARTRDRVLAFRTRGI